MRAGASWSGRVVTRARAVVATWLPMQCGRCPRTVDGTEPWVVGHKISRALRPDLALEPSNWQPEHRSCSDRSAQAAVIEKARAEGARDALLGVFPATTTAGQAPPLPVSPSGAEDGQWTVPARLKWAHHVRTAPEWLAPYLVVPDNASPPLAMTEVHPRAVCSYAAEGCTHGWAGVPFVLEPPAIAWVEKARGIRLRWWQQLAMVRQLEHDAAGRLVWFNVVESGTRRIGKSERLRSLALWRMQRGVELFEPGQTVIHFGNKLDVVREVQERAWPWCEAQGWAVSRNNNNRSVTHPNGARWLAKTTAYSFDVHLGLADECWDIEPVRISEDLEPAALERESAQVVTTSTAHRRATALMPRRISAALAFDDLRTLLLLWGVEPAADIFAESTWRAASAHWSPERRDQIAAKLVEAREAEPTLDDPDPVGSWAHQYLNRWDLAPRPKKAKGDPLIDAPAWAELAVELSEPRPAPVAAAVESWFEDGVSVALAWRLPAGVVSVGVADFADLGTALAAVRASGFRGRVTCGSSLLEDPAVRTSRVRTRPGEGRVISAVQELQRLLAEDVVRHDGGEHLAGQLVELRTAPGVDGPRVVSTGRADAVKAAVWAIRDARLVRSGKPRVLSRTPDPGS
ncbi:HNH endonuclease [Nocardioides bruguierae]|uniref:HNH endonuclease n=1 Tax=Nocardioides bruguierae TaxID=2945102 RepID=A0A9X2D496_9ACTN|nr:HNH endonuclease [Nocardioides bruguierae]MCM0618769.1 HNH endonuclease [Nocardioides bruguierae]